MSLFDNSQYPGIRCEGVITGKGGFRKLLGWISGALPGFSHVLFGRVILGLLLGFFYQFQITVFVYRHAFFFQHFFGQVNGETEGICQFKGIFSGKHFGIRILNNVFQNLGPGIYGFIEGRFLCLNYIFNEVLLFQQIRVGVLIFGNNNVCHFR